jgi:hypothetical protein
MLSKKIAKNKKNCSVCVSFEDRSANMQTRGKKFNGFVMAREYSKYSTEYLYRRLVSIGGKRKRVLNPGNPERRIDAKEFASVRPPGIVELFVL